MQWQFKTVHQKCVEVCVQKNLTLSNLTNSHLFFQLSKINSQHLPNKYDAITGMIRGEDYFFRRSCFLMMSRRLFLVTSVSSDPCLAFCFSLLCCSWRWGELRSWGGRMDPVSLTRFTTSRNRRLLLLLRSVMAVPLCPSRPALPTWMGRDEGFCLLLIKKQNKNTHSEVKIHPSYTLPLFYSGYHYQPDGHTHPLCLACQN